MIRDPIYEFSSVTVRVLMLPIRGAAALSLGGVRDTAGGGVSVVKD